MSSSIQALFVSVAGIGGCRALSTNRVASQAVRAVKLASPPSQTSKIGFSFTPGGLLFPYHLGVAKCLEMEGFLAPDTPLAGASAGAIAAAVVGCGMDINTASSLTGRVFQDCREGGVVFRLKEVLRDVLQKALPTDAHEIINSREGPVIIGMTQLFPKPKGVFVSEFESREDLIEVLLGSCHVPLWFSPQPFMNVRGKATVDGFFAVPRSYFGSPEIPSADQVVRVTVFPTTAVEMHSDQPGDVISPDLLDRQEAYHYIGRLVSRGSLGDNWQLQTIPDDGFRVRVFVL